MSRSTRKYTQKGRECKIRGLYRRPSVSSKKFQREGRKHVEKNKQTRKTKKISQNSRNGFTDGRPMPSQWKRKTTDPNTRHSISMGKRPTRGPETPSPGRSLRVQPSEAGGGNKRRKIHGPEEPPQHRSKGRSMQTRKGELEDSCAAHEGSGRQPR